MSEGFISELLELRFLVGYLGEQRQSNWWPTAFYEKVSEQFLRPAFTRTAALARYHGVLEAARRIHDEHLSTGSYHLFRLPEEVEQNLHFLMQAQSGSSPEQLDGLEKVSALSALKELAGAELQNAVLHEGPVALGSIEDLDKPATLASIAAAYQLAFSQDKYTYPY